MTTSDIPSARPELSIVVPVLNEAQNVTSFTRRLLPIAENCVASVEIIFVDDGSADATLAAVRDLNAGDPRIRALSLSRNFGKEIAIAAGLDHARGDAAVIIDADMQHPPELIATFVEHWRQGYKNVYGRRIDRSTDSLLRKLLSLQFYRLFEWLGDVSIPPGAGDFRLLDRQAIDALCSMSEQARFSKGLYAWIGFKSIGVPFHYGVRARGKTNFSFRKLTHFAFDGLTSFTSLPLKVWTYFGTVVSILSLMTALFFLARTLLFGVDVPGFATLIVSIMFLSGMQLLSLGILGEYIGRIFAEVKGRPLYIVAERIGVEASAQQAPVLSPRQRTAA